MEGIYFDFENNDIVIDTDGTFKTAEIGSQNCALIANSQVCRLTTPEVGETLAGKIINGKSVNINRYISRAISAVKKDGGKNVKILINEDNELSFYAEYDS